MRFDKNTPRERKQKYLAEKYDTTANYEDRRAQIKELSEETGLSPGSITQILVRLELYEAKVYVSKTGEAPITKIMLADLLVETFPEKTFQENDVESLTNMTKGALKILLRSRQIETHTAGTL